MNEHPQTQIESLASLLVLDEEIRKLTTVREFGFFSTNETHRLISYHTSYLWQLKELIGAHLITQSGSAEIDMHAPTNQWLLHKINKIRASAVAKEIHQLEFEAAEGNLPRSASNFSEQDWPEALPHYLLWCPFLNRKNQLSGGLVFFRETPFSEAEVKMLRWLIASYQYTWSILINPQKIFFWSVLKQKHYLTALSVILLCILLFPIRLSILGEGIVVPNETQAFINAPMPGVIKSFAVRPGEKVKAGQLLLTMDKNDLQAAVEVSKRDFLLTKTKLRTIINESFKNKDKQTEVPIEQAQLAIDKANLDYASMLLAKADVKSPIEGIVIFESKEDWVGQPVQTGERILVVADPRQVQLKIIVPVANLITLSNGEKGDFFLYGQLNSISFHLKTLGYNAKLMPNKILAYQMEGEFDNVKNLPQLGSQGTVKIYSNNVPLIYYFFRRPLQAIRHSIGV